MPKALCLTSLVVAALLLLLFLADLVLRLAGLTDIAPLQGASLLMDAGFLVFAAILAYLSWSTYREQV
ncbi:hypothetical protein [Candidatus Laterigemmans baculatus]|uniref:hypothetical protein n=1 Tax=Candidatus Laterigemmans baculatus TaxID=2770505 RepID=UPI0013DAFDD1|nr:hypothetical protein [Candidatus Laterigemmans baculatus]